MHTIPALRHMTHRPSLARAFTIVELLVVIVVIGILTSISVVSYNSIQVSTRDEQRKTNTLGVAAALEKYYAANSIYPSLNALIGQSAASVQTKLNLSNVSLLRMPKGAENSISNVAGIATLAYQSTDTNVSCTTGTADGCKYFTLSWVSEKTGQTTVVESIHKP